MANIKITQLTEIVAPANEDVLPIVDVSGDITQKVQAANLPISTATQTALDAKQETLVSGTNIKTINSTSILGSGDVAVQPTLVSGTNIKTINSTSLLGSGDIAISANPAGTDGQIQFNSSSAFGADSNLFWDNTNKRLGVGETTPTARVQIKGVGTGTSTTSLLVQNSAGTELFSIDDDSAVRVNLIKGINYQNVFLSFGNNAEFLGFNSVSAPKIGVNIAVPSGVQAAIKGSGSTSATTSLLVQNSSGTELLKVNDAGDFGKLTPSASGVLNISGLSGDGNAAIFQNGSGNFNGFRVQRNAQTLIDEAGANAFVNSSAILELKGTTKGFLPPRMTTTQKNAISTPAAGLQVYDSTTNRAAVYTSAWENVITETNGSPNPVYKLWSGSAAQYAALTPDSSTLYFVI